jgi:hypothetical protein
MILPDWTRAPIFALVVGSGKLSADSRPRHAPVPARATPALHFGSAEVVGQLYRQPFRLLLLSPANYHLAPTGAPQAVSS